MTTTEVTSSPVLVASRIDLVDSAGKVRLSLAAYDDSGFITVNDRHGRRVLSIGVQDGQVDEFDTFSTYTVFEHLESHSTDTIDPNLDFPVSEPWDSQL